MSGRCYPSKNVTDLPKYAKRLIAINTRIQQSSQPVWRRFWLRKEFHMTEPMGGIMSRFLFTTVFTAATIVAGVAVAGTLDDVKARGALKCGVHSGLTGFGAPDANGVYQGFDVALCKAIAAAVLGDATKVKYVPTTSETRFTSLAAGEIDVLIRTSTWTFSRDADLKLDFVAVNYYDGQGFMVSKDLGVSSARELDGAKICIQAGTTTEMNLTDYFKANSITYLPVPIADDAEGQRKYMANGCDAYTTDASSLAAVRATLPDAENHIILPEIISKEPLGPVVRHGDNNWSDIVRWTYYDSRRRRGIWHHQGQYRRNWYQ